jgi:hypothetical protein
MPSSAGSLQSLQQFQPNSRIKQHCIIKMQLVTELFNSPKTFVTDIIRYVSSHTGISSAKSRAMLAALAVYRAAPHPDRKANPPGV